MAGDRSDESLVTYYSPGSPPRVERNHLWMHGIGEQLGIFRENNSAARQRSALRFWIEDSIARTANPYQLT